MAQQLPGVLLLQLDEPLVVHGVPLHAGGNGAGVFQLVPLQKGAGHDQVDVQVDALFLELGEEVVEAVQPLRVEQAAGAFVVVQQRRFPAAGPVSDAVADGGVGGVKADHVHAHAGKALSQLLRVLVARRVGARGDIKAQESGALTVFKEEMPVLDADEAVLPGGRVQKMGEIQNAAVGFRGADADPLFHILPPFACCSNSF